MSDEVREAPQAAPADGVTAGTMLRRAREAAGLHVAALAVSLKVPVRKVEALEEDRYHDLGDAVFIRGLASSVCRALKVDPQPVLERLPQTSAPRLVRDTDGLNAPFRAPSDGPAPGWTEQLRQPVPIAVGLILVAAVAVSLWPAHPFGEGTAANPSTPASSPAVATTVAAVVPASVVAPAPVPAPAPLAAASEPVAARPAAPAPAPLVLASAPVRQAPASATLVAASKPVAAASSAVPAAAAASGTVVVRAKGESWVEITDAKGAVAVRKILTAGEAAGASGVMPLQVTIGRVDHTEVTVRGKPFDMAPVSRDNVARFVVK